MMKKLPRADERHGKPTVTDVDSLEPLFKAFACHQCSNQSGTSNQRQGLVIGDTSQTEKPIPEEEPEEEEESEMREVNMMKNLPRTDERNGVRFCYGI